MRRAPKSPPVKAARLAVMVAVATVLVYGIHGASTGSLVVDVFAYAVLGFLLGLLLSALFQRSEFIAWYREVRNRGT